MKLEYFPIHGRAMMIRLALAYCNVDFEDNCISFDVFARKKKGGAYPYGQLPVLYLDDGTVMSQSNTILRYVCAKYKGRNGETLYPGAADPMLSYTIDEIIDFLEEFVPKIRFLYLQKMGTPEYD